MAADLIVYPTVLTGLDPDGVAFVNATVDSVRKCSHGQDHNSITTVPTSKRRMIGPFDRGRFNNAAGKLAITYGGAVVNLTIKAVTVKPTLI